MPNPRFCQSGSIPKWCRNTRRPSQVIQEVDIELSAAGHAVAEPTTSYTGRQFADYALLHHGKPIAVIEAKRTSKDAALGKEQALQYAANLQKIHGGDMKLKVRQSSSQGKGGWVFLEQCAGFPPARS